MAGHHVESHRTYLLVFGALIALTALTVFAAYLPLGRLHSVVAVTIAALKAALVVLFFMHVIRSGRLVALTVAAAVFWLAILVTLTFSDYLTTHWLPGATADYRPQAPTQLPRP